MFTPGVIRSMFAGIDDYSKNILARELCNELAEVLSELNTINVNVLSPAPVNIFHAFRLCSIADTKVVILGQDPYIGPGEATGLSFSSGKGIPPSLMNIYKCLMRAGYINKIPESGDISAWAKYGVLMLNTALTTVVGRSGAHTKIWAKYTDKLLTKLPDGIIYILLGNNAKAKAKIITGGTNTILEWGHPSPLSSVNRDINNPRNFLHCDVFEKTNQLLAQRSLGQVNWGDIMVRAGNMIPRPTGCTEIYIFTDGGSRNNGAADCVASWAYYISMDGEYHSASGILRDNASNNRAELTAIHRAVERVKSITTNTDGITNTDASTIIIVSDSRYSINTVTSWADNWELDPVKHNLHKKKNLDIIMPIRELLGSLRQKNIIKFRHVNSHRTEPPAGGLDWFIWAGNNYVDKLCNEELITP